MTLKIIINEEERGNLDALLQAEYLPIEGSDGNFLLDGSAVDGWAIEDVKGLRRTVETSRADRDKHRTAAEKFEGVDLEEYKRLQAKKEEIDGWDPTNDEAFKTRLDESNATWDAKHKKDVGEATAKAEASDAKYQKYRKRSSAVAALGKHAPDGIKVLLPHVLGQLGVYATEDGKDDEVWVVGTDGRPRITQKAGEQGNMSADELVLAMKDDPEFKANFPGTGATGGGATGGGTGTGSAPAIDPTLSPTERIKAFRRSQAAGA